MASLLIVAAITSPEPLIVDGNSFNLLNSPFLSVVDKYSLASPLKLGLLINKILLRWDKRDYYHRKRGCF